MKKIGVIIGHGGKDCGAVSIDGKVTELAFNTVIAEMLLIKLKENGYEAFKHNRGENKIENIPLINSLKPDLIISLHANSSLNSSATGTEAIYYPTSTKGKRFAEILSKNVSQVLGLKNRGAKEPFNGRGSGLLKRTNAPCVISEPFFINNDSDLKIALNSKDKYVDAIIKSINEYFG